MSAKEAQVAFRRLRLTHELATSIADASSAQEGLQSTLRLFCEAGGWAVGQVWLPDTAGQTLGCAPIWYQRVPGFESFHDASMRMRFRCGEPMVGVVWDRAAVTWAHDIGKDARAYRRAAAAAAAGLSTSLLVPVVSDGHVKAVLEFLTTGPVADEAGIREAIDPASAQLGSLIARKEAETELRHSEARFRAVAETAHDAIVSIDAAGVIIFVNAEAARLLDRTPLDLLGEPVTLIIPERFHHAHRAGLARLVATGDERLLGKTVTVSALRSDGSEVPVELSLSTWWVDGCRFFTAIIRDISERQRAQEALERTLVREREASERLRQLDHLKNTFLDAVSHDLRTPLAAIRTVTSLLQRDADSPMLTEQDRLAYLQGLQANADKMRTLLDDLLDSERLTSGDVGLDLAPVDLPAVVRRAIEEHRAALGERPVHLDLPQAVAEVDQAKVERIVENLLLNAARHTPDGTPVWVSLRPGGSSVLLCVDDAGPGVPEPMRQLVFERFGQVCRQPGRGMGIGLSLVARFAELHGGRAWVEERPGGGASFRLLLPVHAAGPAEGGAS